MTGQLDAMTEANVAICLAMHLGALPEHVEVDVELTPAQLKNVEIFRLLNERFWKETTAESAKIKEFQQGTNSIRLRSQRGGGDVVAIVGTQKIRVECCGETRSSLQKAIGQLVLTAKCDEDGLFGVAVPEVRAFAKLHEQWRDLALVDRLHLHLISVNADGAVEGVPDSLLWDSVRDEGKWLNGGPLEDR